MVQARAGCVGREAAAKRRRGGTWVYLGDSASMVSSRLISVWRGDPRAAKDEAEGVGSYWVQQHERRGCGGCVGHSLSP